MTVEFGYNLYGAPLFQNEKDGALGDVYQYTREGLLKCAISAGMRYAYEYDEMGRMIRKSASGRTLLALAYDKNGNKIRQTDVTGKVTQYAYSSLDLLEKVWDDGQEVAAYDYNLDGTPKWVACGPIRQEYSYDLDKNLTGLTVRAGGAVLADNQYQYDGNGNRIRKKQLGGETLYHYDQLNQVKKVEYPGYTEELYYDKAGNRIRRIAHGVEELYRYDPRNRLTAYTKNGVTTPFRYDNGGNLLADDRARYTYDAFNRTVRVETFDGHVQLNRYDAEGLRYEMEENGNLVRFIFNPDREAVVEEDGTGLARLIRGTELIARSTDAARTYYHYASDEMGSTTHIVDEAGAVQNRYEYDAWGNLTVQEEAVPNRFKYTGQQFDPVTQQYYLRARFYNPVIARFTQEDTYRGDGLNLYAYCANNPVFYVDPTGHETRCVKDAYKAICASEELTSIHLTPQSRQGILAFGDGRDYTVSWMGEETYRNYYANPESATFGASGGVVWVMRGSDADAIRSVGEAARDTGMAPSVANAYLNGKSVIAVAVPTSDIPLMKPTADTPGVTKDWLDNGYTNVMGDGFYMRTDVEEFVTPGGKPLPEGSFSVRLTPDNDIELLDRW